jgi:hypothetical protein
MMQDSFKLMIEILSEVEVKICGKVENNTITSSLLPQAQAAEIGMLEKRIPYFLLGDQNLDYTGENSYIILG